MEIDQRVQTIKNFVQCLWKAFGDRTSEKALAMYVRLLDRIDWNKQEEANKVFEPFKIFFIEHIPTIKSNLKQLPRGVRIRFGSCDNIYVDVQRFVFKSDTDEVDVIRSHLLLINAALSPTDENINSADDGFLGCIDQSTPEGRYLYSKFRSIMSKIRSLVQDQGQESVTVESVMMYLASSGELKKFFTGVEVKNLNPAVMKIVVANTINSMLERADPEQIESVKKNFESVPGFDNIKSKLKETGVKLFE